MGKKENNIELRKKRKQEKMIEFFNSKESIYADAYYTAGHIFLSYGVLCLSLADEKLESFGLDKILGALPKNIQEKSEELFKKFNKYFRTADNKAMIGNYEVFSNTADELVVGYIKTMLYCANISDYVKRYGEPVKQEVFREWTIDYYKDSKDKYIFHAHCNKDLLGFDGQGYPSIEQASITCKNMAFEREKKIENKILQEVQEEQELKKRNEKILLNNL